MKLQLCLGRFYLVLACLGQPACGDPLSDIGPDGAGRVRVVLEPEQTLNAAPPVSRFRILFPEALDALAPKNLRMFEGQLSASYQRRIVEAELSATLLERSVPLLAWQHRALELWVQPNELLAVGETYSLAAVGYGLLAQLEVAEDTRPILRRVWPPPGKPGGAIAALYCSERHHGLSAATSELAPDGVRAMVEASSVEPEVCLTLRGDEDVQMAVPATELAGLLIDPAVLSQSSPQSFEIPEGCSSACSALGPGCLCAEDDRVVLRGPPQAAFFHLSVDGYPVRFDTSQRRAQVLVGFAPETEHRVVGEVFSVAGTSLALDANFRTQAARPHVAINEVYADANGPEPAQEWLELVNSGSVATSLAGYTLEDVGGTTELPDVVLPAGSYAVVVNSDYQADPEVDLAPVDSATRIVVERLGKSGLANSGELIRLYAPDASVVSRFPATPKPKPGVSVARRYPWSLDEDASAFALHAAPGASPGSVNDVVVE